MKTPSLGLCSFLCTSYLCCAVSKQPMLFSICCPRMQLCVQLTTALSIPSQLSFSHYLHRAGTKASLKFNYIEFPDLVPQRVLDCYPEKIFSERDLLIRNPLTNSNHLPGAVITAFARTCHNRGCSGRSTVAASHFVL